MSINIYQDAAYAEQDFTTQIIKFKVELNKTEQFVTFKILDCRNNVENDFPISLSQLPILIQRLEQAVKNHSFEKQWIDAEGFEPNKEGYYEVMFSDLTTDERYYRIRENMRGWMVGDKKVIKWREIEN